MFRRTLPAVAATAFALLAAAFALNRPGERVEIAIDRATKAETEPGSGNFLIRVEGRAINPSPTYRRIVSAGLVVEYPQVEGLSRRNTATYGSLTVDPATGRFRGEGTFPIPEGHPPDLISVELYDAARRTYPRAIEFAP